MYTKETRNGIEDASQHSGLKFIAACNGTTAGGGYELALACDEIVLVDDRSSSVSLPEVPLLAVLPGTGGLTRLTDKRKIRRDRADMFCTAAGGGRGRRERALALATESGCSVPHPVPLSARGEREPAPANALDRLSAAPESAATSP